MRPGIVEVTEQAYARRHGLEDDEVTCWRPKTKTVVMTVIGIIICSFIIYWFVSSIIHGYKENAKGSNNRAKFTRSVTDVAVFKRNYHQTITNYSHK